MRPLPIVIMLFSAGVDSFLESNVDMLEGRGKSLHLRLGLERHGWVKRETKCGRGWMNEDCQYTGSWTIGWDTHKHISSQVRSLVDLWHILPTVLCLDMK